MKEAIIKSMDLLFILLLMTIQIIIIALLNNGIIICDSWRIYFIPMWLLIPCQLLGMLLEIKIGKEL